MVGFLAFGMLIWPLMQNWKDRDHAGREADLIATINEIRGLKTESAVMSWTSKNAARAFPKRTVQGVILSGLEDLKSTERGELKRVQTNIADDFIIMDSNAGAESHSGNFILWGRACGTLWFDYLREAKDGGLNRQ